MSTPASEMGTVLAGSNASAGAQATPTVAATPPTGTASPSSWLSALNPFGSIQKFLPNLGLVLIGVILAIAALVVSQKDTVIKVAARAAEV